MSEASSKSKAPSELSQYWVSHVRNWESSSLNQSQYCRENNLNYSVFHYWKQKSFKSRISATSMQFIQINESLLTGDESLSHGSSPVLNRDRDDSPAFRLWIGRDYCIDIGADFSSSLLCRLVRTLRSL